MILLIVGIVGYFLRRYGYPIAPLVIGLILGPMAEPSSGERCSSARVT